MFKALIILLAVGAAAVYYFVPNKPVSFQNKKITATLTIAEKKEITQPLEEKKSVFVPDWNLTNEVILDNGYNRWIYFGGKEKLPVFKNALAGKNLWTTVKFDDIEKLESFEIDNQQFEGMAGIVVDLEINGLATDRFVLRISKGIERIYLSAKEKKLKMAVALYGDLFYRKRPYDLIKIRDYCDEVMIMAYDYHKSGGEPGYNYPYNEFKKMIDEYLKYISPEKITVIFGMYGYDWTMKNDLPLKRAEALTLFQIESRFLKKECKEKDCILKKDNKTGEKKLTYTDQEGYRHILYYEDMESVSKKQRYLFQKGISSFSFWAWGYF